MTGGGLLAVIVELDELLLGSESGVAAATDAELLIDVPFAIVQFTVATI